MELSFFLNKLQVIQNEFRLDHKNRIVTSKNIIRLGNLSWNIGTLCAFNYPYSSPQNFITYHNIHVVTKNTLPLVDKLLFSSFDKTCNQITLYMNTIDTYLVSHAPLGITKSFFIDLLLSHEIFHFLQCNKYCVLFKTSCLNEIAAYAFTKNIYNLSL